MDTRSDIEAKPLAMPFGGWDPLDIRPRFGTYRGYIRLLLAQIESWSGGLDQLKSIRWHDVRRTVFVCTGNICRSPYAERRALAYGLQASSFGLSAVPGASADPYAGRAANKLGLDLNGHRARSAKDFEILEGDLLIAMEPRQWRETLRQFAFAPCQFTLLGFWSHPSRPHIHDPHRLSDAYFEQCYRVIDSAIEAIAKNVLRDCQ